MSLDATSTRPAGEVTQSPHNRTASLVLAALGIVYGDISTSPLYAVRECFDPRHGVQATPANVLGLLSLVFWALIIVISIKYLSFVMRADNRGEGGILALMALVVPARDQDRRRFLVVLGVFGAALLYGDGMITPAISVLSAVEGVSLRAPALASFVLPAAMAILLTFFGLQRFGTARVGGVFGPVTVVWLLVLGILGLRAIVQHPGVMAAVDPRHAWQFLVRNDVAGFTALGAVFLVVTGGEALYADMGHFGKHPIRVAWFAIVLPALVLNYFGQGAMILSTPAAASHPFYALVPSFALYPMVVLATAATIIASQAVVSGAFSLTRQAIQLGFSPRMTIEYTSAEESGQIYVPAVNWTLMLATVGLVLGFGSSSRLAAAYGTAVTTTMIITTMLAFVVSRELWRWSLATSVLVAFLLLSVDMAFFAANLLKIGHGGWFPLVVAAAIYILMSTWNRGRRLLGEHSERTMMPIGELIIEIARTRPMRVRGTSVFMTSHPHGVPAMLLHNWKHNKVLHEQVIILTVDTQDVPRVEKAERVDIERLDHGIIRILAHYGFMQTPNVLEVLALAIASGIRIDFEDTTYFVGRQTLVASKYGGMARWRARLFRVMSRNAARAVDFFRLPTDRVFEIGGHLDI